eukprot:TRINITY_DN7431_c0_g1_i1.p1 TRINITY_DN7431_c0_g1~~TRINITY_DN7431_c0_g1_i1.p1  ORF type:complete len:972 (-),score=256.51 TRINITY_DN7431_c0_g1_i1:114-3029(-)
MDDPKPPQDPRPYCICRGLDDGTFMINCEGCHDWFHGRCVNVSEVQGRHIDLYYCDKCTKEGKGSTTYIGFGGGLVTDDGVGGGSGGVGVVIDDDDPVFRPPTKRNRRKEISAEKAEYQRNRAATLEAERLKREAQQKREKAKKEAEARERRKQEEKRKTEEEEKQKKQMEKLVASSLSAAYKADRLAGNITQEVTKENAEALGVSVVSELLSFSKGDRKGYTKRLRALIYNLKDGKNFLLRKKILEGVITPFQLVRLDSEHLANQEVIENRKMRDREFEKNSVLREDVEKRYIKTDAGLEEVPRDDTEINKAEGDQTELSMSSSIFPPSPAGTPNHHSQDGEGGSGGGEGEGEDEAMGEVVMDEAAKSTAKLSLEDLGGMDIDEEELKFDDLEETAAAGGNDDMDVDPLDDVAPLEDNSGNLASDWKGSISYQFNEANISLNVAGYLLTGPNVFASLPPRLIVEHRMDLTELLAYLPQLDKSSSRTRTCVYFTPTAAPSSSSPTPSSEEEDYMKLFDELKTQNRAGVFVLKPGVTGELRHSFFKELYLIPIAAVDPKPDYIDEDRYPRDLVDTLIGVFINDKHLGAHIPSQPSQPQPTTTTSTPSSAPTPVPAPFPAPVSPPQATASLPSAQPQVNLASLISGLNTGSANSVEDLARLLSDPQLPLSPGGSVSRSNSSSYALSAPPPKPLSQPPSNRASSPSPSPSSHPMASPPPSLNVDLGSLSGIESALQSLRGGGLAPMPFVPSDSQPFAPPPSRAPLGRGGGGGGRGDGYYSGPNGSEPHHQHRNDFGGRDRGRGGGSGGGGGYRRDDFHHRGGGRGSGGRGGDRGDYRGPPDFRRGGDNGRGGRFRGDEIGHRDDRGARGGRGFSRGDHGGYRGGGGGRDYRRGEFDQHRGGSVERDGGFRERERVDRNYPGQQDRFRGDREREDRWRGGGGGGGRGRRGRDWQGGRDNFRRGRGGRGRGGNWDG